MRFTVLGPVSVMVSGEVRVLRRAQARAVLGFLVLNSRVVVSVEQLIEAVWGGAEPATARNLVQSAVSALRRQLREVGTAELLVSSASGYLLDIGPQQADLLMFDDAVRRARTLVGDGRIEQACQQLRTGLALWRGPVLGGCTGAYVHAARHRLSDQRLTATETLINHELSLGNHDAIVAEFMPLLDDHPFRENLRGLLMRALYRCGRQAEALDLFHDLRQLLRHSQGIDPDPRLQELAQAILRADRTLVTAPASPTNPEPLSRAVPAQLPADVQGFAGRSVQLAQLDALLPGVGGQMSTAPVIVAISASPGVGKTVLAMHWAHRVRDQFPDGQLYVNLHGFDPNGQPTDPAEALHGFLDAFAVPPHRIPPATEARAALYRSLMAGKRVLVVLDNARNADQVRPLLPGTPGCFALITSRTQLTSIVIAEAARPLTLQLLSDDEAHQLLTHRLGPHRIAAEPHAAQQISTRCARLPLALAIVAARAARHPHFPLATHAAELHRTRATLDAFTNDDTTADVRAVFSWSCHRVSAAAARLFRLLGLRPGPEIATPAAASIAGLSTQRIQPLLAELTQANLITEPTPRRYALHDLLGAYAMELSHTQDPDAERDEALHRILDHYAHTAHAAQRIINPAGHRIPLPPPQSGITLVEITDHPQALDWTIIEQPAINGAVTPAVNHGLDRHTWHLTSTLAELAHRHGRWPDQIALLHTALAAAQRLTDQTTQAHTHRLLARAYIRLGRCDDAHTHHQHALDLFSELGDHTGQARTHLDFGFLFGRLLGQYPEALRHAKHALDMFQAAGDRTGQATALNNIGWYHATLGNPEHALTHCQQALTIFQALGHQEGEAYTWDSLGHTYHQSGDHQQAAACYQQAINRHHDLGHHYNKSDTLTHLGDTHHAAGNPEAARTAWHQALTILDNLNHPDAHHIRIKLHNLNQPTQPT